MSITFNSTSGTAEIKSKDFAGIEISEATKAVTIPEGQAVVSSLEVGSLLVNGKAAYSCRAWVNIDGHAVTSANTMLGVRDAKNIASVLDQGVGSYRVYFQLPMTSVDGYVVTTSLKAHYNTHGSWMVRPLSAAYFDAYSFSGGLVADEGLSAFAVFDH